MTDTQEAKQVPPGTAIRDTLVPQFCPRLFWGSVPLVGKREPECGETDGKEGIVPLLTEPVGFAEWYRHTPAVSFSTIMVPADFMGGGMREWTGSLPRAIFGCNYETPLALL